MRTVSRALRMKRYAAAADRNERHRNRYVSVQTTTHCRCNGTTVAAFNSLRMETDPTLPASLRAYTGPEMVSYEWPRHMDGIADRQNSLFVTWPLSEFLILFRTNNAQTMAYPARQMERMIARARTVDELGDVSALALHTFAQAHCEASLK